jgi:hypothetical protein
MLPMMSVEKLAQFNWECPYCRKPQVATNANHEQKTIDIDVGNNAYGRTCLVAFATACLDKECQKLSLRVELHTHSYAGGEWYVGQLLEPWNLLPASSAKPQPDYIPEALRDDYYEACAIRDLSPKASATLARRCLQGMIRNFCEIVRKTLFDEIEDLKKLVADGKAPLGVTPESVDAILVMTQF